MATGRLGVYKADRKVSLIPKLTGLPPASLGINSAVESTDAKQSQGNRRFRFNVAPAQHWFDFWGSLGNAEIVRISHEIYRSGTDAIEEVPMAPIPQAIWKRIYADRLNRTMMIGKGQEISIHFCMPVEILSRPRHIPANRIDKGAQVFFSAVNAGCDKQVLIPTPRGLSESPSKSNSQSRLWKHHLGRKDSN